MSSTFAPSLTAAIIFRSIGSHDRYRKRGLQILFANGRKKRLVKVQGCSHKRNARREYKRLETTERLLYLFILPRNEGLPQKMQTKHTDTLNEIWDSLQREDKTGTITLRLVFWISLTTDLARCNEKRRALRSSKNQIDGVLSRIFIHSHCKARSHNPKGSCACREKKKRIPVFDHTYCGLNITTSQNSIEYRKRE